MKAWKLLLAAALVLPSAALAPKTVNACPWPPCQEVCRYFGTSYCYYDECCNASCCDYSDWSCLNPCSP